MSYPCFIERASICRERFQGTLLNPAETTGALTSPLAVPQLAGRKLIWIWLCALVCFQRRKSLTLGVSDLLLLTLLSIFFFFSLLGCGFHNEFMLNWRKYHLQMSPQVSYIASPNLPHVKDPEPEWLEGKLNQTDKHPELQRCLKTDFTKNMMWAEATYPNPGQSTFLYKFHPLPIFSISTRKKGPAPCCYATVASVWLTAVSTQSRKKHAHFSQEQNWSGRATGSQRIPVPSTPALLLQHHLSLQSL